MTAEASSLRYFLVFTVVSPLTCTLRIPSDMKIEDKRTVSSKLGTAARWTLSRIASP